MKATTQREYIRRIDQVVAYLNERNEDAPTLDELADIAGLSRFHFHRVYRLITGETPSSTVRRLRLARAASMLRDSRKPITEIALSVGYESSQAFSKAFREATGSSASALRRERSRFAAVIQSLSQPPDRPTPRPVDVRLVSVEPFKVIASRHVGLPEGIFGTFGKLFRWAERSGLTRAIRGIYGIPVDDVQTVAPEACRFDCCFDFGEKAAPGEGRDQLVLGGGLYAVLRHVGSYEGLEEKYGSLLGFWLSSPSYALRDVPLYNHYHADPDTLPEEKWETDVYLPIEELR